MVAGGLRRLCCFLACVAVLLLLGTCLHDVEASNGKRVIHKKVGDTVELSSYLSTKGVTTAYWKYGGLVVADKDGSVSKKHHLKDRVDFNLTSFSLTVRKLTLQDSGDFSFFSEVNEQQRGTVDITLQVHEAITQQPDVKIINATHNALDKSCTVLLECSASSDSTVTYNWTVRNQTRTGPKLHHVVREEDGDTTFTCTVSNFVSEKSAFKNFECNNDTSLPQNPQDKEINFILILSVAGGCCLMIVIGVGVAVYVCHCKERQTGSDINDLTVYADIADVAIDNRTMKPCSVYETIDNRTNTAPPGPQTVYDKIQLSRVRKASVSPYQDVI
ncbi:signaling lymphocytic activation molecule [Amphiprion ocellaris]|uniref:signaling lymphocytic activation molecule n=1 Tax=Amphiprion ocellaris TaxID=80972 RepID=UPI000C3061FE|nr:signaling lymphocytic activation molecule [Amphiprion ocellaris]